MKIQRMANENIDNNNVDKSSSSNVILIDPNTVNINNDITNGIPQYQDMYIFAELTAQSKGRTVIMNGETGSKTSTTKSKKINFIGNNQDDNDPNNPNYLNFTTNYYDGSSRDGEYYEGFGINSIKILTNSSFIPQVDIQFVDIRGLAFFNQTDSPYRVLFDFPPPIFSLTVKGYYGKAVTYKLHLVSYTSEFSSENGNFIIDAKFVAMTYAPLTDILFRYVVNAPLIDDRESMTPRTNLRPKTTFELILKLKNLYAAISKKLDTDAENVRLKDISLDIEKIELIEEMLVNFKNNEVLNIPGSPQLTIRTPQYNSNLLIFPVTNSIPQDNLTSITSLSPFNDLLKSSQSTGTENYTKNQLYMLYLVGTNVPVGDNTKPTQPQIITPISDLFDTETQNEFGYQTALSQYKKQLLAEKITTIDYRDSDITDPDSFLCTKDISNDDVNITGTGANKYYGINITRFYTKLYNKKAALITERNALSADITRKINSMIQEKLGMLPSVYNVFDIILNDVDTFFNKIRAVSKNALESHNIDSNKEIIIGSGSYAENKNIDIYSFPLIINKGLNDREERVAPIELRKKIEFPEIDLVTDFMDTFLEQGRQAELYSAREGQNDDGVYNWIPISPLDSTLGGATPESPYLNVNDNVVDETLRILLKRFYMLSQGTIPDSFYATTTGRNRQDKENIIISGKYSQLYSKAEAINLASSLISENNAELIKTKVLFYKNNIQNFYDDITNLTDTYATGNTNSDVITGNLYKFPTDDPKYFLVAPSNRSEGRVYVDRNDEDFEGINIITNPIKTQDLDGGSDTPIGKFASETIEKGGLFRQSDASNFFEFANENIIVIRDTVVSTKKKNDITNYNGDINLHTRYLANSNYIIPESQQVAYGSGSVTVNESDDPKFPGINGQTDNVRQQIAYSQGNVSFSAATLGTGDVSVLNSGRSISGVWADVLSEHDNVLINTLTGASQNLSSVLVLSNFGYTISPFNKYPNAVNSVIFNTPSAIETPAYLSAYLGALINANEDPTSEWTKEILDFFTGTTGSLLDNRGFFVLSDLHDVATLLSENDKTKFRNAYSAYMRSFNGIVENIGFLYESVQENYDASAGKSKYVLYNYLLNPNFSNVKGVTGANKGQYFSAIMLPNITREYIVNFSEITFSLSNTFPSGYTSLAVQNTNADLKATNDNFFNNFFRELNTLINDKKSELKEEEEELRKAKGDEDIINQLYYSFKNINDKWLTGTSTDAIGYPFNGKGKSLIDSFAFVDRGMNPIGETMINAEILIDMLDDPNISLFSVLTQLLSLNGFEFFPIQNFLRIDDEKSWVDSFKLHTGSVDNDQNTFFVCMYIGGSSSYPSVSGNGFDNDGITHIDEPGLKGFNTTKDDSDYQENIDQEENQEFPWRQVRAFQVKFGEQNQSMFTNMKIDSKEYPETNESIQILSRLAGDDGQDAPVPKGQSLYNLYENRSYKATVTGFGNAMIQPTQYFQLENIPLFNGAYIILSVEHNITANKMTTSFSGTKLLKYPVPRVLSPVALTNYDGLSAGDVAKNAGSVPPQATMMTKERISNSKDNGGLDSVFGVDVSAYNKYPDWKKAKASGVEFVIMKLSQGPEWGNSNNGYVVQTNYNNVIANDIPITFYHFAHLGETSDPAYDGRVNANNFISRLSEYDTPDLPVVLDIEDGKGFRNKYKWSNKTTDVKTFVGAFIDRMEEAGYEVMIYSRTNLIESFDLGSYYNYPLWVSRYFNPTNMNQNAEISEPDLPPEWSDWDIWQFSSQGNVEGIPSAGVNPDALGVDINVMRKSFFNKYIK